MCVRYVKERHQFNGPIGRFQLVQERLSRMHGNIQVQILLPDIFSEILGDDVACLAFDAAL